MASVLPDSPSTDIMNSIIMNYFVTEGFKRAAETLQSEACMPDESTLSQFELDNIESRIQIRDAVVNGKVMDAIAMINDLHPQLLDDNRSILFHLQLQQFIEMIKSGCVEKAVDFAAEHLSRALEDESILNELERSMALLAFDEPSKSPFADLLSQSQRLKVAAEVNASLLKAQHAETTQSKLVSLMKLLLWSQHEIASKTRISKDQIFEPLRTKTADIPVNNNPDSEDVRNKSEQVNYFDIEALLMAIVQESSVSKNAASSTNGCHTAGKCVTRSKSSKSGSSALDSSIGQQRERQRGSNDESGSSGANQRRTVSVSH